MMSRLQRLLWILPLLAAEGVQADPPVASYIFPAGGRRGTTVEARVGGLNLHHRCGFEVLGPGLTGDSPIEATRTVWFEGPVIPLPDSQQAEDYPRDHAARLSIAPDAPLGVRHWRVWTAQGATPALPFVVGELPEIVEQEVAGDPVPVPVSLPVTINGRIFPREDVDVWTFPARKGETVTCEVNAARLGSPLDARLEVRDSRGRRIAEGDDALGADPLVRFRAPEDGTYRVAIQDANVRGGQALVYRLTITAGPDVESVYPLGGRRGTETRFSLFGANVPGTPVAITLPADDGPDCFHQLRFGETSTNPFLIALDDLPETLETEPNDDAKGANALAWPSIGNGRIDRPGDVDLWAVRLARGDAPEVQVQAAELGSTLVGVLSVLDDQGKELAKAEGQGKDRPDPSLRFAAPRDGLYLIRIADRFASRGGPRASYRLRMSRGARPDFHLRLATDALALPHGKEIKLRVEAVRSGSVSSPIALEVDGLPRGVSASGTTIAANQGSTEIAFRSDPKAPIVSARLTLRGTSTIEGREVRRIAEKPGRRGTPAIDSVRLAVTLATPFQITADTDFRWAPRGTVHHRKFRIDRRGFDGPIEVRLADRQARHLQGVTGPTLVIPAGVSTFDYPATLPPWMETGRTSRSVLMATGAVKDAEGLEHEVSYTSPKVDVQIIAVVEPSRLALEAGRGSVASAPGTSVVVPVRVARGKSLRGPVTLELVVPEHVSGIAAPSVTIPADRDEGDFTIAFERVPGPNPMPVVIRGTVLDRGDPVVAETRVVIGPEEGRDVP